MEMSVARTQNTPTCDATPGEDQYTACRWRQLGSTRRQSQWVWRVGWGGGPGRHGPLARIRSRLRWRRPGQVLVGRNTRRGAWSNENVDRSTDSCASWQGLHVRAVWREGPLEGGQNAGSAIHARHDDPTASAVLACM
eukprot:7390038-Prymnesium_polylepis.2